MNKDELDRLAKLAGYDVNETANWDSLYRSAGAVLVFLGMNHASVEDRHRVLGLLMEVCVVGGETLPAFEEGRRYGREAIADRTATSDTVRRTIDDIIQALRSVEE